MGRLADRRHPVLIVAIVAQRKVVEGPTIGAVR
jgi:hypothetical protein